eukprot:CAMPEP_0197664360 /NCGR_PEP_ID=MMETSP1338-20131121/58584_1 /TAXON_ID=43686 ORGANISM="Pelagodinium beii, Strain RCC1491" /NCGR_SAMPLE_ID=MMETSP1338 /ASSEMBLY_ACC=CAM_ASM_000754 /LENGTH=671 /DNA_ID=CAMNT_0043242977 /DNA_START=160 /DNA_END=2175 /DNA_ORIENTATION=-
MDLPRSLAGSRFGGRKLVVITGTSSGLGLATTKALLRTDKYHVIGGVRNMEKMKVVAEEEGISMDHFTPMHVDLASFASVHKFVEELENFRGDRPIDRLACNAAVYQPTLDYPKWSEDGHEQQHQINYFSHFLLTSKIMPMMEGSDDARICMLGSVTGNDNTVGGGGVYPIADLKELEGLELGCKKPIAMMDGYNFNGAKAYKDTKLACMMTCNMLHERFHRSTGIAFSSVYPGCIAETPLFREKRPWFRKLFPVFMKYITGGYVGEEEAGQRLFQVLHDPRCTKSGVYWGWNGGPREGREDSLEKGGQITGAGGAGGGWDSIFENDQSDKVLNKDLMMRLWQYTTEITGAEWPEAYQPKSPCPTLKVIDAVTSVLGVLEERSRMEASRQGEGASIVGDRSVPREERRKSLEQMLLALDKTPRDQKQLEEDMLLTSGMAPEASKDYELKEPIKRSAETAVAVMPELDDPVPEEPKGPPQMIPGHELLGDTPVVFQPQNVMTMARVGQPLSEVASQADVFIRYKCKKGECKTCAVNIDGKWVCACQTKIESVAPGQHFGVRVRPVSEKEKRASKAAFFSPESVKDGFFNNAFGMLGFVKEGIASDDDFEIRMARERRIQELTAKKAGAAFKNLRGEQKASSEEKDDPKKKLVVPAAFGLIGFMVAVLQPLNV